MLIAGAGVGVYLVQQQQLIGQKALTEGGVADIYLDPATSDGFAAGQNFNVEVKVDTKSTNLNQINAVISFPSDSPFVVTNVFPNDMLTGTNDRWSYQRLKDRSEGNQTLVEIIMQYNSTQQFAPIGPFTIATIALRVLPNTPDGSSVTLSFTPAQTTVLTSGGEDILGQTRSSTYTVGSGAGTPEPTRTLTPSATVTQGGGANPTNSPNPSPTTVTNPTNSPTPSPTTGTSTGTGGTNPSNTPAPTATSAPAATATSAPAAGSGTTQAAADTLPQAGVTLPTVAVLLAGALMFITGLFALKRT